MGASNQPQCVQVEREGQVAIVRLDRPPVNALELGLVRQASDILGELVAGDSGAVVLTGSGLCFSAGLDLKLVPTYSAEEQQAMITAANRFLTALYSFPRPVVAAVNGHAIAGGLIPVLACDYRVGTREPSKIGLTEARAGISFPAAAMAILKAELAPQAARVLTLLARNIDTETALAHGILDELQPAECLLSRAVEVARDMAGIPPSAYARIKQQVRGEVTDRLNDMLDRGADPMLRSWIGSEASTAAASLLRGAGRA